MWPQSAHAGKFTNCEKKNVKNKSFFFKEKQRFSIKVLNIINYVKNALDNL